MLACGVPSGEWELCRTECRVEERLKIVPGDLRAAEVRAMAALLFIIEGRSGGARRATATVGVIVLGIINIDSIAMIREEPVVGFSGYGVKHGICWCTCPVIYLTEHIKAMKGN